MMKNKIIGKIILMRGIGYTQEEIADELVISRKTVENHLRKLKTESEQNGINTVFWDYVNIIDVITEKLTEKEEN